MDIIALLSSLLLGSFPLAYNAPLGSDQLQVAIHDPYETDQASSSSQIRGTLKLNSVIDDVLDDFSPSYSLTTSWPSSHESAQLGNDIPVSSVSAPPTFAFSPLSSSAVSSNPRISKNTTYTLALTDPDATSRDNPKWSEMCHWIVTNITIASSTQSIRGNDADEAQDELVKYMPPAPPPKTGKHRYVLVLLAGDAEIIKQLKAPSDRKHWGYGKVRHGVRDWAGENGLEVVGANFFFAQNEKQ